MINTSASRRQMRKCRGRLTVLPPSASRLVPRCADAELRDEVIETLIGDVVVTLRGEIRPTLPGSITQRSDFGRILRFLAFQETETFPQHLAGVLVAPDSTSDSTSSCWC